MKKIFYFLGALGIAIGAAFYIRNWLDQYEDPGYALLGIGHWQVETSLIFFLIALALAFILLYVLFRVLGILFRLPKKIKNRPRKKAVLSQDALISGLVDSAEGNWEKAEKVLIKHASNSGAPLLHYLTAARAAQSRGSIEKRDEYLKKASKIKGDTDIALGLTTAELHLSANQFDEALETLTKLHSMNSGHASVLKLLHKAYQHVGDWEGIRKLLPSLHKNKVLMEAEVKLLENETFSRLLKQAARTKSSEKILELWVNTPGHIKSSQGISTIYYAAMIEANAGIKVEADVAKSIEKNWDETLLIVYANIDSLDYQKQLQIAEKWVVKHPSSAVLLRVLGKISLKAKQIEKAEQYLVKSVGIDPSVAGYQLLGDVLMEKNDPVNASECYKRGLELASNEIVQRVEEISG